MNRIRKTAALGLAVLSLVCAFLTAGITVNAEILTDEELLSEEAVFLPEGTDAGDLTIPEEIPDAAYLDDGGDTVPAAAENAEEASLLPAEETEDPEDLLIQETSASESTL